MSAETAAVFDDHLDRDREVFEAIPKGDAGALDRYAEHIADIHDHQVTWNDLLEASKYPELMQECRGLA